MNKVVKQVKKSIKKKRTEYSKEAIIMFVNTLYSSNFMTRLVFAIKLIFKMR